MKTCRIQLLFILFFILPATNCIAQADSTLIKPDSSALHDSVPINNLHGGSLDSLLKKNKYLNTGIPAISLATKQKANSGKEFLFYLLGITILVLALFKVFYTKYFNNIFRVFFNSSLRQNQLTDLLLQSKLPSLIFNIFFVISAGLYAWLILIHYNLLGQKNNYIFIALSVLIVAIIYFGKFIALKLIGWISGMSIVTDRYIFVIFLINKITGILLIPFIVLLAFAPPAWLTVVIVSSFIVIGILFLLRYLRTFGLLQNELKINALHFLLYIIGIEFLPIMIIYKVVFRVLL